jgi:hypothetical protein
LSGSGPQRLGLFQRSAVDFGARRLERARPGVGPRQAEDAMSRADQFRHNPRTDKTRSAGHKYTHGEVSALLVAEPPNTDPRSR